MRLSVLLDELEGEVFQVRLDSSYAAFYVDQALGIKDSVLGIGGQLILGSVSDEPLSVGSESDIAGGDPVSLVIGNDFDSAILEDSDTRVGGSQINANYGSKVATLLF